MISRERSRIFLATNNDVDVDIDVNIDVDIDVDVDHNVVADFKVIIVVDVDAADEIWSICHQCVTRIAFQREFII